MSDYLIKPNFRKGASMTRGDKYQEGQAHLMHVTLPSPAGTAVPPKTEAMKKVEVADPKVLEAKDKKKKAAEAKAHGYKPRKRQAGEGGSVPSKRRKKSPSPVVNLDSPTNPAPEDTIPPEGEKLKDPPTVEKEHLEGHSSNKLEKANDGVDLVAGAGSQEQNPDPKDHNAEVSQFVDQPATNKEAASPPLRREGKGAEEEEDTSSSATYVPGWSIKKDERVKGYEKYRDLMVHLPPPAEEEYMQTLSDVDAASRSWGLLARGSLAFVDLLVRFESLDLDHRDLAEEHSGCEKAARDNFAFLDKTLGELKTARDELGEVSAREVTLKKQVRTLEAEKAEWSKLSQTQAEKISSLEKELMETKGALKNEEEENAALLKQRQDLAVAAGNLEIEKSHLVRDFLPTFVARLHGSHEYKVSLAAPFSLSGMAGWLDGVSIGRSEEEVAKILADTENLDVDAPNKYLAMYDELFVKKYPYVAKVRNACHRPLDFISTLMPDPAPEHPVDEEVGGKGDDGETSAPPK